MILYFSSPLTPTSKRLTSSTRHLSSGEVRSSCFIWTWLWDAFEPFQRLALSSTAHIADCPHCRTYFEQIRTTIALTGQVRPDDLDPQAQDELIALYRQWRAG